MNRTRIVLTLWMNTRHPRRHYDEAGEDAIVIWFQPHGDPDGEGGEVGHIVGFGRFENVTIDQTIEAIETLTSLGDT